MSPALRRAYLRELSAYERNGTWASLERAHVLSQAYAAAHGFVHWRMLGHAVGRGHLREAWGQLLRLVLAAPGSWLGRAPLGNTGGADVGLFRPVPIPADLLAPLESDARSARFMGKVGRRAAG